MAQFKGFVKGAPVGKTGTIVEWLKFRVPVETVEEFIATDAAIWTRAIAQYPGFLGKEVWIDPQKPNEILIVIRWQTREQWKSIPEAELAATERQFAEVMETDWEVIAAGEYFVCPLNLDRAGESRDRKVSDNTVQSATRSPLEGRNGKQMDEITRQQARQGSMAALIQVMNEHLADARIRTRAAFADGVLQILCEAKTAEPLQQKQLVPQLQSILQELSPRNFRRVCINARIACEQQVLWREEISRHPEKLLWSEEIHLKPPNLLQQLGRRFEGQQQAATGSSVDKSLLKKRSRPRIPLSVAGAALLCLLAIAGFWGWQRWIAGETPGPRASPTLPAPSPRSEPFVEAVRLAETSAIAGTTANTAAEWLELAAKWQRAADLMKSVPESDPRHRTAVSRAEQYRKNSKMAQQQARRLQSP